MVFYNILALPPSKFSDNINNYSSLVSSRTTICVNNLSYCTSVAALQTMPNYKLAALITLVQREVRNQ